MIGRLPGPPAPAMYRLSRPETREDDHEKGYRHARTPDGGDG